MLAVAVFYAINTYYANPMRQGLIFLLFGSFMFLGAIYAWAYLPEVQREVVEEVMQQDGSTRQVRYLQNKTLEELGEGRERARQEGEILTVREKWAELKRRGRRRLSSVASGGD
jgi:PHS family inorganic phosphate transporter-like MFS transporter